MNISNTAADTSLEDMFQRMGDLLKNIAASRTGLADEMVEIEQFHRAQEPGLGERVDLSA